jgi:CubicO group peptidase (beta-lactamase class C family)
VLRFAPLLVLSFLAACAHSEAPPPAATPTSPAPAPAPPAADVPAVPQTLASDTPRTSQGGATYVAPGGWSAADKGAVTVLTPPEGDSHVAVVSVEGADAKGAVEAAWKLYKPDMTRPVKLVTARPGREGWEERQVFDYETSPNERAVVQANAFRKGTSWTVILFDGTEPTFEKRIAPTLLVLQSLRPQGYARESFAGRKAHPLDAARIETLKEFVRSAMDQLGVPGVGLAFIDQGKVVWEGGLGVRKLGKPEQVDANTLFMAASNTKGMTTLLLARLVDRAVIRWDEPVVKAYPAFKLADPEVTRQVLFKHLICACTGLPRQDLEFIFEFGGAKASSTFDLLAGVKPTSRFGEVYQYSNLMASAAGYIGGHLYRPKLELGAAYDRAMQDLVFRPLGMRSTTFDFKHALRGNHASPHGENADGKMEVASLDADYCIVPHRPAGGVWTSAHDFARYVQLELTGGKLPDGKRLVSEESLIARRRLQVPIGEDHGYGMGLMVGTRYGTPVVHHGGDVLGYHSDFAALPEYGVGMVVLTNADNGELIRGPLTRRLLEVLFDGRPEAEGDVAAQAKRIRAQQQELRSRLVIPPDPAVLAGLGQTYRSPELGPLRVVQRGDATVLDVGEWRSTVGSRKNDDGSTSLITIDPGYLGFEFVIGEREAKRVLITRDGQHEYLFVEQPAQRAQAIAAPRSSSKARRIERWQRVSSSQ